MSGDRRGASTWCRVVVALLGVAATIVSTWTLPSASLAADSRGEPSLPRVPICHATASATTPFTRMVVADDGTYNGHSGHAGDIIPAPSSGCPTTVATCESAGLPCEQIPLLPTPLLGLVAGGIGALAAGGIVVLGRTRRPGSEHDHPDGSGAASDDRGSDPP